MVGKRTWLVCRLRASEGGEWQQKTTTDKKIQKKSEINSGFESQVKIKRSQIHTEGKREREREREREMNWREKPDYGGLSLAVFSERQTKADSWSQQWEPPESQRWSVWSLLTDWCGFRSFNPSGFKHCMIQCQTKCLLFSLFAFTANHLRREHRSLGKSQTYANCAKSQKLIFEGLGFKRLCVRTKKVKKWVILTIFAFSFTFNRHTKMSGWLFNVHGHGMTRYSYEYFYFPFWEISVFVFLLRVLSENWYHSVQLNVMILRAVHLA